MKNVSIVLNVLLLAAVGYLYIDKFSAKKTKQADNNNHTTAVKNDSSILPSDIAYVDLDSLNENISFIKARRQELEAEQKRIEIEWQNGYKGLEEKKNNFLKKGAAITQEEAQQFQEKLYTEQQQIDSRKQQQSQALNEKSFKAMEGIQKDLKEFLTNYNKEKHYRFILTTGTGLDYMAYKDSALNITKDVVKGMNEKAKGQ